MTLASGDDFIYKDKNLERYTSERNDTIDISKTDLVYQKILPIGESTRVMDRLREQSPIQSSLTHAKRQRRKIVSGVEACSNHIGFELSPGDCRLRRVATIGVMHTTC